MGQEVAAYIDAVKQEWQVEVCRSIDRAIRQAIPEVQERIQYGKPHYLKDGKYACVLGTAKGWVSFTIFNATALDAPDGLFEPGPSERKTMKVRQGQAVDYGILAKLVGQAAQAL